MSEKFDPAKKTIDDAPLNAKLAAKGNAAKQPGDRQLRTAKPLPVASPLPEKPVSPAQPAASAAAAPEVAERKSNALVIVIAAAALVLVLLIGGGSAIAYMLLGRDKPVAVLQPPQQIPTPDPATPDPAANDHSPPPVVPPPANANDVVDDPVETLPAESGNTSTNEIGEETDEGGEVSSDDESGEVVDDEMTEVEDEPEETTDEEPVVAKLPVPEKSVRDAKRADILQIFPVAKLKTPEEKAELAQQLIQTASETSEDPVAQFALLNIAREQASEAGDVRQAFEAIDMLADIFKFDADAVRVSSLQQASRVALPPAAKAEIVIAAGEVVESLAAADKIAAASAVSDRMLAIARALRGADLLKQVTDQRRALDVRAASFKKAQAAFDTLKTSPDDAAANLAAGRYLAFVKDDWDTGLVHLVKGSDATLAAAASAELSAPTAPAAVEKLGDAWWSAAEAQKEESLKQACSSRAAHWYREVIGELSGLAKVKVEKRLREVSADAGHVTATAPDDIGGDIGFGPRQSKEEIHAAALKRMVLGAEFSKKVFDPRTKATQGSPTLLEFADDGSVLEDGEVSADIVEWRIEGDKLIVELAESDGHVELKRSGDSLLKGPNRDREDKATWNWELKLVASAFGEVDGEVVPSIDIPDPEDAD